MGFIAGYVSKTGRLDTSLVAQRVRSFRMVPSDEPATYETTIMPIATGHLMHHYKPEYPIKTTPRVDRSGNVLVSLGFLSYAGTEPQPETLCNAPGEFVCMLYNHSTRALHIINDRFGCRPFYFFESAGTVYFSSNLAFLLWYTGTSPEFDMLGWFQTFGCSHTVGTRTTYQGISSMQPGSHVTISDNAAVVQRQYWGLRFEPETMADPMALSREVSERFRAGVDLRARLVGRGMVALSGGLDSRLIAGAIPKDTDYVAFTFSNPGATAETEVASMVAHALGIPHETHEVEPSAFSDLAHDVIRLCGGMRPFHHVATAFEYIKQMQRSNLRFLLGGGPGDILGGSKIPSLDYCDPHDTRACLRDYSRKLTPAADVLETIFQRDVVRHYHKQVSQSFADSLRDTVGPTAAHRVTAWAMRNRWTNFTFTSLLHTHPDVSEAFPHLDYGFVDLMLKLPATWLYRRNFYAFMLYHSLPELREIIYSNTGRRLGKDLIQFDYAVPYSVRAKQLVRKLARAALPHVVARSLRRATSPHASDPYSSARALRAEVEQCLDTPRLRCVLDIDRTSDFVRNYGVRPLPISPVGQRELMGNLVTMCLSAKELP